MGEGLGPGAGYEVHLSHSADLEKSLTPLYADYGSDLYRFVVLAVYPLSVTGSPSVRYG